MARQVYGNFTGKYVTKDERDTYNGYRSSEVARVSTISYAAEEGGLSHSHADREQRVS